MTGTSPLGLQGNNSLLSMREELLDQAQSHLAIARDCAREVQSLAHRLRQERRQVESNQGGLLSFNQSIHKEESHLLNVIKSLRDELLTEDLASQAAQRLDHNVTAVQHFSFQWSVIKRGRRFVAINQIFQSLSKEDRKEMVARSGALPKEKQGLHQSLKAQSKVEVDVLDWGTEWVCIRWVHQERLARQLNDCGWCWGYHPGDEVDEEEWKDTPFAKHVEKLVGAARLNRAADYGIPKIRLVLPNIDETNHDISVFLEHIRRRNNGGEAAGETGQGSLVIETGSSSFLTNPAPALEEALGKLVGNEMEHLTSTINLDHSILVDMISDLTHLQLEPKPWQGRSTQQQIGEERSHEGGLMAKTLYPLLRGRKLVCTREAALHFRNMLKTVGTPAEKRRGQLLVRLDDGHEEDDIESSSVRDEWASLSIYKLPPDIQVPICVIDENWTQPGIQAAVSDGRLPGVAGDVAISTAGFSPSKRSIFFYGWAAGIVTLTSNKEIRGQLRTLVEAHRHEDGERGPRIFKLDVTRNLLSSAAAEPVRKGTA